MLLLLKLTLVPTLICAVTLATRRWGMAMGGWLASLPVSGGPILLFYALEQGTAFAADAARFTVLSGVGVATYCLAYGWAAQRLPWMASLSLAWLCFLVTAALCRWLSLSLLPAFGLAVASYVTARKLLPPTPAIIQPSGRQRWDLPLRVVAAVALVLTLTYLAERLGSRWIGLLTAFPVASAVVGAFSHSQSGAPAAIGFFRGMLGGMHGFSLFCAVLALTLMRFGITVAFAMALGAQLLTHAAGLLYLRRSHVQRRSAQRQHV